MNVQDVMTRTVATCRPRDTLNVAAKLMWDCDCGCVPVLDDDDRVCGMITDRDICMAAYTQGRPLQEIEVHTAMSPQLYACGPTDTLDDVQRLMQERRVRRIPVTDGGRLVGVLSLSDLLVRTPKHTRLGEGVREDAVSRTFAVISTPSGRSPSTYLAGA